MRRTGTGSGGGVGMNKVVKKPVKPGKPNRAMSPCAVAQIGGKVAHARAVEKLDAGKAISPPLGNELAARIKAGPGGSREVRPTGYQAVHSGTPRKEA